ncbi:hypothetical protein VE01_04801 [Pseudogymnoascus verrucosus]|uniref:Nucleoporin Nup157/170 n=1 Tax=Pseudogymnoascus verrucosus TaxID=342668 RepID=A0A1B8GMS0_9PEZI|nr:uncharacterized protein VE01_04801 [Pseudogymnoascus verrucosus]OBT97132.1 hypothetical protein VE01_04801 [Pseudogymnoascus verrucosus]
MSFPSLQTPQRPLPGAFVQTPAASRYPGPNPVRQLFRAPSSNPAAVGAPTAQGSQSAVALLPQAQSQSQALKPVQRAGRTINEVLRKDANFPELDSYVKQGISSDYEIPSVLGHDSAWAPYQKTKMYDIPDRIFEQYNHAQVSTMMGLFSELNHAWITIDNALYIWDYTQTNPELNGFEEQSNSITAVKLVVPRRGVFLDTITHLLVVATTAEIILLGVGATTNPATGAKVVTLFNTGMSLSIKGIDVRVIEGSAASGRIFFSGGGDNEVYELTYQQEEKWFASRCGKVNHTSPGYTSLVPTKIIWGTSSKEYVVDMTVDDSRNLLYTLSSESSIRIFHMDTPASLKQVVEKKRHECLRDISHMISQSPLLDNNLKIVSISPISATEAAKLHLLAVTSTGCRLYLSATRGYGYLAGKVEAPTSMQVQHIKFPPPDQQDPQPRSPAQPSGYQPVEQPINTQSRALQYARRGLRYPPGFFLCFVAKDTNPNTDVLFLSAPDTGRIAAESRDISGQSSKFYEQGLWLKLDSRAEAIGLVSNTFAAASTPIGYGNELAVQFDEPSTEMAVLTNTGIYIIKRRRLVDVFAAAIRQGDAEQGLEKQMAQFIRHYGRSEVTAAALAVACGQGSEGSSGERTAKVSDPSTLEAARKAFIDYGGSASLNADAVSDANEPAINFVRPSARHDGLAMYISRLVRSIWKVPVVREATLNVGAGANGTMSLQSTVSGAKLTSIQDDMARLNTFLEKNSTFIQGLAGPEGPQRAATQMEEITLQGEHQALRSLWALASNIIEGISFVMMLFEERMDELWASLDDTTRQQLRDLTYESLFTSDDGKNLGKVLVKAIVNRSIANGSNVETVADALRRKCKSFCSADDVLIFKAQEQLKKASELGSGTEVGRSMLNGSLRLFERVAESLTFENLQSIVEQYVNLQFYAGAVQLCLTVAYQGDRGNMALSWVNDNRPAGDSREKFFESRKRSYDLIHLVLEDLDRVSGQQPEFNADGMYTVVAMKRQEAYAIVNESTDEVFHYDLYDWYLTQGWTDRLLAIDSPFVISYLQKQSLTSIDRADLLWRFYASGKRYHDAASVQVGLAKSEFPLDLKTRIEYLSRAKANGSTTTIGIARSAQQVLLREVTELLEIANIQDEILQRLRNHPRLDQSRREEIVRELDGPVHSLSELFNEYADKANFYDICLEIFQAAGHSNPSDVDVTWTNFLDSTHGQILEKAAAAGPNEPLPAKPYEAIINAVRDLAYRLNRSESTFPPELLIPKLERYAYEQQRGVGPPTWVMDLFIEIGTAFERIIPILEGMIHNDEAPFHGRNRRFIANDALYVIEKWYQDCIRHNREVFGGVDYAAGISTFLNMLTQNGLEGDKVYEAQELRVKIERVLRR